MSPLLCRWGCLSLFGVFIAPSLLPSVAFGQMVTAEFPFVGVRDGFSEGIRTNWALRGPGAFSWFNNNSGSGIPAFGGFSPNAGLGGGFGIGAGNFGANLGFNFAQGSSRSMISNTPVVTGFAGQPMFFQNNVQRPFVTNLIPAVGNGGAMLPPLQRTNPLRNRLANGEFRMENGKVIPAGGFKPAPGEAQIAKVTNHRPLVDAAPPTRAEREAQQSAEDAEKHLAIRNYLKKGQEAEAKGKHAVAKQYYQMAARRAEGELKQEALASLGRVAN
jgi:hypothetical protein